MRDDEGCATVFVAGTQEGEGHALRAVFIEGGGGLIQKQEGLGKREGCCQ